MTESQIKIIRHRIESSGLSKDAKWTLRQFLNPISCGCGHTLTRDGVMIFISTFERKAKLETEINESGFATATTEITQIDSESGAVEYQLAVVFLPIAT